MLKALRETPFLEALPDEGLVLACRDGEANAWGVMVSRFERLLFTIPRRAGFSQEDAGDVFQTVMLRLYENLHTLNRPERVRAWLVTTAKRETLRILRERAEMPLESGVNDEDETPLERIADEDPLPDDLLGSLQMQHRARTALGQLGEPCHTLLTLLYTDDTATSYGEISSRLNMPEGSIGPTRARCLDKLRKLMHA